LNGTQSIRFVDPPIALGSGDFTLRATVIPRVDGRVGQIGEDGSINLGVLFFRASITTFTGLVVSFNPPVFENLTATATMVVARNANLDDLARVLLPIRLPPSVSLPPSIIGPDFTNPPGITVNITLPGGGTVPPDSIIGRLTVPPNFTVPPGVTLPGGVTLPPPGSSIPDDFTIPPGFSHPGGGIIPGSLITAPGGARRTIGATSARAKEDARATESTERTESASATHVQAIKRGRQRNLQGISDSSIHSVTVNIAGIWQANVPVHFRFIRSGLNLSIYVNNSLAEVVIGSMITPLQPVDVDTDLDEPFLISPRASLLSERSDLDASIADLSIFSSANFP